MRRIKIAIAALLLGSAFVCINAADKNTKEDFDGYWNFHVRGGAAHTVGETAYRNLISPSASIGFGYQFTPVWGIRADINGWQGKGAMIIPQTLYSFKFVQANVDATIDICSIFNGFRLERLLNPYLLVGVGVNGRFDNDGAAAIKSELNPKYFWEGTKFSPTGRAGVGVDIRLSDVVDLNLEVNSNILTDKFNSKQGSIVDFQNNALVGLKFNFGRSKAKASAGNSAAVASAAAATSAAAAAMVASSGADAASAADAAANATDNPKANDDNNTAQKAAAQSLNGADHAKATARQEKKIDVFFTIGKWAVNPSETGKINELIEYMKADKSSKVTIIGYADKNTGSAKRNMFISQKRAETIASKLIDAGIAGDRVKTEFKGCSEAPYESPAKNRVAICIAK